jgi:hypothetical protein
MSTAIECSFQLIKPPVINNCTFVCFTNPDVQYVRCVTRFDAPIEVTLNVAPTDSNLIIQLFGDYMDPATGATSFKLYASGWEIGILDKRISLFENDNSKLCEVSTKTLSKYNYFQGKCINIVKATQLIRRTEAVMDELTQAGYTSQWGDRYTSFDTPFGKFPIIAFAAHVHRIQYEELHAIGLFNHWAIVAAQMNYNGQGWFDVLVNFLTLTSRSWYYKPDCDSHGQGQDQWISLFACPNPGEMMFDCEDGTKAIMEIFHVLQDITRVECMYPYTVNGALYAISKLANYYSWTKLIGYILDNDGKNKLHYYGALLGKDEQHPSILIDSTLDSSGVWVRDAPDEHAELCRDMVRNSNFTEAQQDMMRYKISMNRVKQRQMYAEIVMVFNAEGHKIAYDSKKKQIGCDPDDFFRGRGEFKTVISEPLNLDDMLQCMPTSKLPLPPVVPLAVAPINRRPFFTFRTQDKHLIFPNGPPSDIELFEQPLYSQSSICIAIKK